MHKKLPGPVSRQSPGGSNYSTLQSVPHLSSTVSLTSMATADTNSLKRKGRFRVKRVRSGSADDDDDDEVEDEDEDEKKKMSSPGNKKHLQSEMVRMFNNEPLVQ
jgi:hypothetical protein